MNLKKEWNDDYSTKQLNLGPGHYEHIMNVIVS